MVEQHVVDRVPPFQREQLGDAEQVLLSEFLVAGLDETGLVLSEDQVGIVGGPVGEPELDVERSLSQSRQRMAEVLRARSGTVWTWRRRLFWVEEVEEVMSESG